MSILGDSPATRNLRAYTIAERFADGDLAGYVRGYPTWRRPLADWGADVDAEVCAGSTCDACGHVGLGSVPYSNRDTDSYRAFAVCPACGHAEDY